MKQYTENQYDDDLTVGTDDYDDSYYTGSVDLFEFANDEESPISRLKSLILSIDWEITDEVLMQFNEELVDLRDIWAGEKINLVYVQALEKISKYIYQKKADSHPSAIKLLLTLYHNLEKIVSSTNLSEEEKREILLQDVKRFESLKRHIGEKPKTASEVKTVKPTVKKQTKNSGDEKSLLTLKAIVLSIDWEITDQDLNNLRKEVVRLEKKFADSRPRLILLQGIGTLCAYIKLKKSNAHADAFKILHLFYDSLEKIVNAPLNLEEEKAILFPAVEQFNSFKLMLGPTIEAEAIKRDEREIAEEDSPVEAYSIAPAFADLPEEEVKGFQAEEEAQALGVENSGNINHHIDSFFTGSDFQPTEEASHSDGLDSTIGDFNEGTIPGVDVELDDEEEQPISEGDGPAPALSFAVGDKDEIEPALAFQEEESSEAEEYFPDAQQSFDFVEQGEEKPGVDFSKLDRDTVLQGVQVESEADDDSDEEALPRMGGKLAPALAENDEMSIYNAGIFENSSEEENLEAEVSGALGGFFDEEIESHLALDAELEADDSAQGASADASAIEESPIAEMTVEEAEPIAFVSESELADSQENIAGDNDDFGAVEDNSAEIDEHLDTFFNLEESVEGLAEDKLTAALPDEPAEENVTFEQDIVSPVFVDTEEEVVFELVEEDEIAAVYQPLQTFVESIGREPDDAVISSLWAEIDHLYQELSDKPLEKTYLHLLSALTRHIDKNRFAASGEAYVLLQSVCGALSGLQEGDLHQNQEKLMTATDKVLKWQEELLTQ